MKRTVLTTLAIGCFTASTAMAQLAPPPKPAPPAAPESSAAKGQGLGVMIEDAKSQLESSTAQLAKVRAEIDAERMPVAKKLDELETALLGLRKEYDGVARTLDTRNLDISNLKGALKAKEDETFYISNLLDEFTRGFESKVHISEMAGMKPELDKAKAVMTDTALGYQDKFAAQLAPLKAALARGKEVIGGARYTGTAINEQGTVLPGKYALIGPMAIFGADDGSAVGIAVTQTGSTQAVVKPLEETMNEGIAKVLATGEGIFPLDPTNGNALKALLHKTSLIDTYIHGGPIMHPLLLVSLVAFSVVIERVFFLMMEAKRRKPALVMEMLESVEKDDFERAIRMGRSTKDYVAKTILYALEHREKSVASALMLAAGKELKRLGRGLPVLDTCITLAPLLGLLGTVTGMMHSFSMMGGDLGSPTAITGGISEALIATAFGLVIAIVAVVPYNYLNARVDDARHQIEAAATRMELIMKGKGKSGAEEEEGGFKLAAPVESGGGGAH